MMHSPNNMWLTLVALIKYSLLFNYTRLNLCNVSTITASPMTSGTSFSFSSSASITKANIH